MQVYFACSITGGREFEAVYQAIVTALREGGHVVPTAHLSQPNVVDLEDVVDARQVYVRDIAWIESSDALVAEVSTPSHGVGYEIAYALAHGKPVLCCYQEGKKVSKMITGNHSPGLTVRPYRTPQEVRCILAEFFAGVE
ncbi:MAG: nucleoside 2-deoxyribosyltransferase [Anaerolineales bacterium]|nr:nucleoside 2-deoxyribosyltransferase [Anaerolineales bacterium]